VPKEIQSSFAVRLCITRRLEFISPTKTQCSPPLSLSHSTRRAPELSLYLGGVRDNKQETRDGPSPPETKCFKRRKRSFFKLCLFTLSPPGGGCSHKLLSVCLSETQSRNLSTLPRWSSARSHHSVELGRVKLLFRRYFQPGKFRGSVAVSPLCELAPSASRNTQTVTHTDKHSLVGPGARRKKVLLLRSEPRVQKRETRAAPNSAATHHPREAKARHSQCLHNLHESYSVAVLKPSHCLIEPPPCQRTKG